MEKRFGAGIATTIHKIEPPGGVPEDSPQRRYPFCENGVLLVRYDPQWRVHWAHYADPYSVKGRIPGVPVPIEEQLRELEPRLRQIVAIAQEFDRRFPGPWTPSDSDPQPR